MMPGLDEERLPPSSLLVAHERTRGARVVGENIVLKLRDRELHSVDCWRRPARDCRRAPGSGVNSLRRFYLNVVPNLTVVRVEKTPPVCYLRKFSPDGRWMVAFSAQQSNVEIHEFRGAQAAGNLLAKYMPPESGLPVHDVLADVTAGSSPPQSETSRAPELRHALFDALFVLRHSVSIALGTSAEQLHREFSVFSESGRHVIVAASAPVANERVPPEEEIHRSNESLSTSAPLEDYSFYAIDLAAGVRADGLALRCDRVALAHNQGVSLCGDMLAILSLQHQCVYVYRLTETGLFVPLREIGRFLCEDDRGVLVRGGQLTDVTPLGDPMLTMLRQRILAFLYRQAAAVGDGGWSLRRFFLHFEFFRALRLWRAQFLGSQHLLLRLAVDDVVAGRADDPHAQSSLFVVYDIREMEVIAAFESVDEQLVELYEKHADDFRYVVADDASDSEETPACAPSIYPCSLTSSANSRLNYERYKQAILGAKLGGRAKATRQILSQLPFSAQAFATTPYLDLDLFSYDEKWISPFERPKLASEFPVRFYARTSGKFKFQLHCGPTAAARTAGVQKNCVVAFIVHPFEPFVISVQRLSQGAYVVNFHLRFLPP